MRGENSGQNQMFGILVLAFIVSCVFDPADRWLGAKIWLFLACWFVTILSPRSFTVGLPQGLLLYLLLFVSIPTASVCRYFLSGGGEPYEGITMLKGYFLISLSILLLVNRYDLLPKLSGVLSLLAICVLFVFVILDLYPALRTPIYLFGSQSGMLALDKRDYGDDLVMNQVYFVTSPMLAISIAYYFSKAKKEENVIKRNVYWLLFIINTLGMYFAGTRNNILVSVFLPILLWFLYTRHKMLSFFLFVASSPFIVTAFHGVLSAFFNPAEQSNEVKLGLVKDYILFFSDVNTLLFGQGLGAYVFWEGRGSEHFISELTYLEIIRNFGIFGAFAFYLMLIFPFVRCFFSGDRFYMSLGAAYAAYLVICMSNPNLFMSMGVLILSVLLANIYMAREPNIESSWNEQEYRGVHL